jgi:hypothetical protein
MSSLPVDPPGRPAPATGLNEVRYSLPELLREIEAERNAPAFANEKLDQVEISKLFQKKRPRRANKQGK